MPSKKLGISRCSTAKTATILVLLAFSVACTCACACAGCMGEQSSKLQTEELDASAITDTLADTSSNASSPTEQSSDQTSEASKPDIVEQYYDDLQHGDKGAAYQKYIVLHDTEGGGTPENVVSSWESSGNLIAAHFVIGKDGRIVQCVPLDKIGHHAGWGSGDANARFGIEEDGRDDLLGRKATSHYTDYGMNAWSVGIEMIHIGGEGDYPEEQLKALDSLIAYIDAYYGGNAGEIIDHKMWREGNSDTSEEFAGYLANYRDHRTHE